MRRMLMTVVFTIAVVMPRLVLAQSTINAELAPIGKLRVAMNAATPALLTRAADGKVIGGVAFEVGTFIAQKLGVPVELVPYTDSRAHAQSFDKSEWDISFGPRNPVLADKAVFIADVVLSEFWFVAAPGREFWNASQVDRPGVKIGVGADSTADRFLRTSIKSAELVHVVGGGVEALRRGKADVWAASASNVQQVAGNLPGAKIVPGAFMSDRSMLAVPKGRSAAAQAKIAEIVTEAKQAGVVQKAIEKLNLAGVRPAP
jgi:polar amino acid transport system substrate-binding protein